ncbi:MAG: aminopeptidase P family protein [Myxococcales bacterium]|nr:aminopeptidase P family protein [Myxococcales bacterium]
MENPIAPPWSRRRFAAGLGLGFGALSCAGRRQAWSAADEELSRETPPRGGPFAGLAAFCVDAEPIQASESAARRERARELARAIGVDAIVLEAGVSLYYLTGVRWGQSERPLLYVLPVEGAPLWLGPAFESGTLGERVGDEGEIHLWEEHEGPYTQITARLAALGRVAVDPAMRLFVVDALRQAARQTHFEIDAGILSGCRMIKSPAELALLRRASEATKEALRRAAAEIRVGMSEATIAELVREAQEAAGLTDVWTLVLVGSNAAFPHGTNIERVLSPGDAILVDTGGSLHGYRSDVTRTWFTGKPSAELRAAWEVVHAAQAAALAAMRPGVSGGSIDEIARQVIDAAGHGPGYRRFTHRLGHGIGLQVHEDPYLVGGAEVVLAPGMVMSNEPGIYVPGEFGIRIEDIVAITPSGVEVFGPLSRSIEDPFGVG